jgi:translocation and assembly module TamB
MARQAAADGRLPGDARGNGGPPAPAPPARRRRRWPWAIAALLLLLPLLLAATVFAAWRSLHTEAGTRWWLATVAERVPGLALGETRGALLGAQAEFTLDSASFRSGGTAVQARQVRIDGLQLGRWQLRAPYVNVEARTLALQELDIATTPSEEPGPPPELPQDLRLPLTARIDLLRIDRLQLPGLPAPVEGLSAHLEAGDTHRIDALALRWNGLLAEGSAFIDADAPLTLRASLAVRADAEAQAAEPGATPLPDWARGLVLQVVAGGPLERFDATATLELQAQRLNAKAQITPFEAMPLSQLDARFAQLDLAPLLAPFMPQPPTTALTGSAVLQLAAGEPLSVQAQIANALPGRWDRQRVPVREIDVRAGGQGADWQIERATVQFAADAGTPAGRLEGSGRLDGGVGAVELKLDGVLLQQLDRRAPPLRLSGPIRLKHTPDGTVPAPAAPPATAPPASAARGGAATPSPSSAPAFGRLDFDVELTGLLQGAARQRVSAPLRDAVRLAMSGRATPNDVVLDALDARAGKARLDGKARARRDGNAWESEATLKLTDLDPRSWLPGDPDGAWRRARSLLNGSVELNARVPADAADAAALLARLRGTLNAKLTDSALAGQPLNLSLQAQADGAGALSAEGQAGAAGNTAQFALRLAAPAGRAAKAGAEHVELELDAPALARLAPLAELFGLGPLGGQARLAARVEGGLGATLLGKGGGGSLSTRGSLGLQDLQAGTLQLDSADAEWNATLPAAVVGQGGADALAGADMKARVRAAQLRVPGLVLPSLSLDADGTLAEHRASLRALLRQPTPEAGSEASATPPGAAAAPLALAADLRGAWRAGAGDAPSTWRATLGELSLKPTTAPGTGNAANGVLPADNAAADNRNRAAAPQADGLPLLVVRDLQATLEHGAQLLALRLEPGRAEVLGAALRWSRAQWRRSGTAPPQLAVQAEVEPVVVAELLQRLQPDFGWAGDLRIGARIDVSSDPAVRANIEIARTGGDLQISEFGTVQSLGLTEARVTLDAQAGVWRFAELIAGGNLGRIEGRQTVRAEPTALWPAADAPIEGQIDAKVENLAAWGAWVPAGWRLGGAIDASLRLAGRFGAPELIGEVRGRELALRNALEGVALREGRLDARFEGASARLEVLSFKAGEGELRASGTAELGAQPQAKLQIVAEQAQVLARVDRRIVVSGDVAVRVEAAEIAVTGKLGVDRGLIDISQGDAPALADDVTVRRPDSVAAADKAATEASAGSAPRAVDLELSIDLGERLQLRGRGIDTRLTGRLRLTTPDGRLTARGEIRTDRGTYKAYGQDLDIEQGVITFVGSVDNPRLNIEAVRANTDVRVGVRVTGSAQAPRVQLFSDPEMPAAEKLALLVTGKSYDSLAGSETLLLQRAALALLAGDGSGGGAFDPAKLLQLDELSVRQSDGATADTIVTLGKQLSDRVYVGYERGLNAAAGNWQLIYRIAQRFTVRAQSGEDPAVDFIWMFRWN